MSLYSIPDAQDFIRFLPPLAKSGLYLLDYGTLADTITNKGFAVAKGETLSRVVLQDNDTHVLEVNKEVSARNWSS